MTEGTEWIRARGLGRERLAGYLADYLTGLGYAVTRLETPEGNASVVSAELKRMNPAVPAAVHTLRVRFVPTSGGAAGFWESPTTIGAGTKAPVERFLRELTLHLERTARTESHGTARVQALPGAPLPVEGPAAPSAPPAGGAEASL